MIGIPIVYPYRPAAWEKGQKANRQGQAFAEGFREAFPYHWKKWWIHEWDWYFEVRLSGIHVRYIDMLLYFGPRKFYKDSE